MVLAILNLLTIKYLAGHEKLVEALRDKHKNILDSRDDEITELKIKLSDSLDSKESLRVENESL